MELILIAMIVLLPLLVSENYRRIVTVSLVNIVFIAVYRECVNRYITLNQTMILIIISIGLIIGVIVILIVIWFGIFDMSGMIIPIGITCICYIIAFIQKLIVIIINIIYNFGIQIINARNFGYDDTGAL